MFSDSALTTVEKAAAIILDGIRDGRWRIMVGADAVELDRLVRETPDEIYDEDFVGRITSWRCRPYSELVPRSLVIGIPLEFAKCSP